MERPYSDTWETYWRNGWRGILPLPPRAKHNPPRANTGRLGTDPSYADCFAWADDPRPLNLALRLPPNLVGIDVDGYAGKPGFATMSMLEAELGELPDTLVCTARTDGSGTRLFRIPDHSMPWRGISGMPGVDIIQHEHRYLMAAPSIHPELGTHVAWTDQRSGETGHIPHTNDIPELPAAWVERLRHNGATPTRAATETTTRELLDRMPSGDPCQHINQQLRNCHNITAGRHDTYRDAIYAIMCNGRRGCPGAADALNHLGQQWLRELTPDRGEDVARSEYARMIHGATELVAQLVEGTTCPDAEWWKPDNPLDDLFNATPVLASIRQAAESRLVSPTAVLGAVLARISAEIPPHITLPPIIGGRASLNLYVGLVGPSGSGKTSAVAVADEWLNIRTPRATIQGAGTGEGLIESFIDVVQDGKRKIRVTRADAQALVLIDEISTIGAIQQRNGSTLAAVLRTAWSGQLLETVNADPERRRRVEAHTYRLAGIAGIQPELAGILFDDHAAGTPQRWLWMSALNPDHPDELPAWPGTFDWKLPQLGAVILPEEAIETTRELAKNRLRGTTDDDAGHTNQTRLKTCLLIALLHGHDQPTVFHWKLAGQIIEHSDKVRADAKQAIAAAGWKTDEARGKADARRAAAAADWNTRDIGRAAKTIARAIHNHATGDGNPAHKPEDGCTMRCINRAGWRYRTRFDLALAVDHAEAEGWTLRDGDRTRPGDTYPT